MWRIASPRAPSYPGCSGKRAMGEIPALCAALYGGMVMGAIYDGIRCFRLLGGGKLWNALLDLIYYALVLCIAAATLLYINGGVPRVYLLLAMGAGLFLYMRLVSAFLQDVAGAVKKRVARKRRKD